MGSHEFKMRLHKSSRKLERYVRDGVHLIIIIDIIMIIIMYVRNGVHLNVMCECHCTQTL